MGAAVVYLVAATEPQSKEFHHFLHKLDVSTGQDKVAPVEIAASATMSDGTTMRFNPPYQWIRAGLAWANGTLYVGVSSHCDHNADVISGWLLRYSSTLQQEASFSTIYTPAGFELASIWMAGFGPAIDADGSVFVVTGNGNYLKGGKDWGESVLKLPKNLARVADFFTPSAYLPLNGADCDFGSGGVLLLPVIQGQTAPPLAVAMGKDATLYLLDRTALGKSKPNDASALQALRVADRGNGVRGGPAYFLGPNGGVVYYQTSSDVLRAYAVSVGTPASVTATVQGTTVAGYGGSIPLVSSNGSLAGTGVVWLVRRGTTLQLEAYDAEHLGAPLYVASAGSWPSGNPLLTPLVANGRVYVPSAGAVSVFGLTP
jgi:hypothetical protein